MDNHNDPSLTPPHSDDMNLPPQEEDEEEDFYERDPKLQVVHINDEPAPNVPHYVELVDISRDALESDSLVFTPHACQTYFDCPWDEHLCFLTTDQTRQTGGHLRYTIIPVESQRGTFTVVRPDANCDIEFTTVTTFNEHSDSPSRVISGAFRSLVPNTDLWRINDTTDDSRDPDTVAILHPLQDFTIIDPGLANALSLMLKGNETFEKCTMDSWMARRTAGTVESQTEHGRQYTDCEEQLTLTPR
ncbi:hypothetical protein M231_02141 [Tremella mesenterica]|uniref:Uncharacterized protein n=1 Tax=Tremella mesenterica TaxID=5217 RepID=A0A4Q1BRD5_TREME|nr:uncharacterized protein TREMEDRAFT_58206 [Tremella mesenterica DSM 1558]EIW72055.1 hypothetical protein TREMEDRAFT_58206 [Tremella mesenterica DSM 1558]RXK40489.1 hypothetical protein M231_02141 [Tremella mesenterica]